METGTAELCRTQWHVLPSAFPACPGGFFLSVLLLTLTCLEELTCLLVFAQRETQAKIINPAKIIFLTTSTFN